MIGVIIFSILGLFLCGFLSVCVYNATNDWFENRKRSQVKRKEKEAPSTAFQAGYMDMATGLVYGNYISSASFNFKITPHLSSSVLSTINKRGIKLSEFNPDRGRTSKEYLRGSGEEWQQYYSGGIKLLEDIDAYREKLIEEERLEKSRREGVREIDRSVLEGIKQLEILRNKTFEVQNEHKEFDQQMREVGE